ncbi:hypothetical protein HDV01_004125 [Terramyces sp. JEL0728]|nr:hypothetical protein HDV01_004125 [Terramyces sp. JEL0728]
MYKESIINFNPIKLDQILFEQHVIPGSEAKTFIQDEYRIHISNNEFAISNFEKGYLLRLPELVLRDCKCFGNTILFATETHIYKFHFDSGSVEYYDTQHFIKIFTCPSESTIIIYDEAFFLVEFEQGYKNIVELKDSLLGKIAGIMATPGKLFRGKQEILALDSSAEEYYYLTSDGLNICNFITKNSRTVPILIEEGIIFLFDDYLMVYTGYEFVLVQGQVIKRITAKIDLVDFIVLPKDDTIREQVWQIFALYGNQMEYLEFTLDDESSWSTVYHQEKDHDLVIEKDGELIKELDEKYFEFVFSNKFHLYNIAQVMDYEDTLAVEPMRLHLLSYISKSITKGDYTISLSESWHNFLSRLLDYERNSLASCGLSFNGKTINVAKLGHRIGIITHLDCIDLLKPEMERHLLFGPVDEKIENVRDSLKHLADLTRSFEMNPIIEQTLFYSNSPQMSSLEELAEQFYPEEAEQQVLQLGYAKISDFEGTLNALITLFQSLDYKTKNLPNIDGFDAKIITELTRNMINDRYIFIKKVYSVLLPLVAMGKQLPKNFVALWQSLTVCYHSQYIAATQNVLSALGWNRAYPLGSLSEAQSVVTYASKFMDYTANYSLFDLLLTLPTPSPATCFIKAKVYLQLNDYYNARVNFESASCGNNVQPNKHTDLGLVVPSNILQGGVSLYYLHVMQICNEFHPDLSVHFGKLALRTAKNGVNETEYLLKLQKSIFSCAIQAGDYKSAYEIVISIQDKDLQRDILRALITELCDANELELLVGGFSFAGLTTEVENTLLFKARNEAASAHQKTVYYKIAYAYFVYRGDYRNAALVMYHQAHKLTKIMWSERVVTEMARVCTIMTQCYLVAYNALSLLDGEYAYLISEEKFNAGCSNDVHDPDDINPAFTPTILYAKELKKYYHLSLAKLVLFPSVPHFSQTFQLPLSLDVYSVYCSQRNYKAAKATAELFDLEYDKVVVMAVQVILAIYGGKPCPVQGEFELNAKTPLQKAWQGLQKLLHDFDSPSNNYKYHQLAIKTFLSTKPELALPTWIYDPFKSDFCDILIRIYLQHNRLKDATNLSISHLQEISFQTGNAHFSKWISVVTIEHLIRCLEKANSPEKSRLDNVLKTYFNETLVQSRTTSPYTLFSGAQFLKHELPIRLAHRVVELENLPHDLSKMPSVNVVKDWYTQSFKELQEFDDSKFGIPEKYYKNLNYSYYYNNIKMDGYEQEMINYNEKFIACINNIKNRHSPTTITIAQGVIELKDHWKRTNSPLYPGSYSDTGLPVLPLPTAIQSFLDRFYMSRMGIRMLIGQHVAVSSKKQMENYVGIICTNTSIEEVVQDAIANAQNICQAFYGLFSPPTVKIVGIGSKIGGNFMYVPSHLHHMLFELLKNSMRAIVERFGEDQDEYPEIKVVIAEGKEDITIKISDEGGGIPRSGMPLIWTYMYTTAEKPIMEDGGGDFKAPLAGYGYGLPLSRLYARYFGGSFGKVKLGKHTLTGHHVAVKIVDKIHAPSVVREIETWRQLRHPNIAQLYEVICSESKIYMVTEYCVGGELLDYITKNGKMDDTKSKTQRIFQQIVEAVGKCHEKNFAHRDLKLENILLTEHANIKLIDFGFTRGLDDNLLETYCGSSAYAAPEIINGQKYSGPEADIWSLGIILYTMVCGYLPFDEESDKETHKKTVDLISRILKKNPAERIGINEILTHPWFNRVSPVVIASTPPNSSLLSKTSAEIELAAKLEAAGFDVPSILNSVHSNACDQSSALWHLLLSNSEVVMNDNERHSIVKSPSKADSIEISLNQVDHYFEDTHRQPAFSENPILQMARENNPDNKSTSDPVLNMGTQKHAPKAKLVVNAKLRPTSGQVLRPKHKVIIEEAEPLSPM